MNVGDIVITQNVISKNFLGGMSKTPLGGLPHQYQPSEGQRRDKTMSKCGILAKKEGHYTAYVIRKEGQSINLKL